MNGRSAFAAFALGVALLERDEDEAVARLSALAQGRADRLRDARTLLDEIAVEPDARLRAEMLIERAVTRCEQARHTVDTSRRVQARARGLRARARELRARARPPRDETEDGHER